ncbi:hypothetical protein STEG23_020469 [Scotinomys teguina]
MINAVFPSAFRLARFQESGSIILQNHINSPILMEKIFLYIEPSLHFWDEAYLTMVDDFLVCDIYPKIVDFF